MFYIEVSGKVHLSGNAHNFFTIASENRDYAANVFLILVSPEGQGLNS